jgi:hypothetical protein
MLVNVDALGAPVATARFMGGREFEIIASRSGASLPPLARSDLDWILTRRIFALPSFSAAGGPFAATPGRLIGANRLRVAQRVTLATLYVALMTDYLLERLGFEGEVIIDGPLAHNSLYGEILAALRPASTVCLAPNSVPAVVAALYLSGGHSSGAVHQTYTPVPQSLEAGALADYRTGWLEAINAAS